MKNKEKRKFSMTDSVMLMRLKVALINIKTDHNLFLEKFPWLDDACLLTIQNDIKAAGGYKSDFTVVTENKIKGNKQPQMKVAKKYLDDLFKFVAVIYSSDRKKLRMFGKNKMAIARNNIPEMITLLKHAHACASDNPYKNDLLNRGYTQAEIDNLQTVAATLSNQHSQHDTGQTNRPVSTTERIALLNTAFEHLTTINKCARVVFLDNPQKIKLFKIYP